MAELVVGRSWRLEGHPGNRREVPSLVVQQAGRQVDRQVAHPASPPEVQENRLEALVSKAVQVNLIKVECRLEVLENQESRTG